MFLPSIHDSVSQITNYWSKMAIKEPSSETMPLWVTSSQLTQPQWTKLEFSSASAINITNARCIFLPSEFSNEATFIRKSCTLSISMFS